MQTSCGKCGATYEFDASVIPPEGYHAQCTGCGEVFFVKPEAAPAAAVQPEVVAVSQPAATPQPEPVAPALITVTCNHCGAVYQFAPSDIPAGGYDAQCTQCQSVFFVSTAAGEPPAPEPAPAEPAPVEPAPVDLVPKREPEPVTLAAPKAESAPVVLPQPAAVAPGSTAEATPAAAAPVPATAAAVADPGNGEPEDHSDMLALDDELGEPDAAPDGSSMEDDFEKIMRRKRKRLMTVGGVLVAIPLLLLFLFFVLPGVWDATIGPLVGVKARVNPQAIPLMEEGLKAMLNDTDKSYDEAIKKFEAALAVDQLYPEALAFVGLAYLFKGKDVHARGLAIREEALKVVAEITALNAEKKRPRDADKTGAELRQKAMKLKAEASKLNEEGSDQFAKGWAYMTVGLQHFQSKSPLVVGASGIFLLGRDKDRINDAEERLLFSLDLYKAGTKIDLKSPPDPWLPYLGAMIRLATRNPNDDAEVIDFYQAALKKEPRFQRARYDLASALETAGKNAEAIKVAEQIIGEVPKHKKAKDLIAHLKQNGAAPQAEEPVADKKKKKKTR